MKTLYIDCGMGAAGDMMTAALLELLPEKEQEEILDRLRNMGLAGVTVSRTGVSKCGISGTHMKVSVNGVEEHSYDVKEAECEEHAHHSHDGHGHGHGHVNDPDGSGHGHHHSHQHMDMSGIEELVGSLDIAERVKKDVMSVYGIIAEAESHVHGTEVSMVHGCDGGMPAHGSYFTGQGRGFACACRQRPGEMCTWDNARAGSGNGLYSAEYTHIRHGYKGGAVYTDRGSPSEIFCG